MNIRVNNEGELHQAASELLKFSEKEKVFLFEGDMGAGKTTFTKAICRQVGVVEAVSSPTYAIINEYETSNHCPVYHFDFYRLKTETEALDLGLEEYLYSGSYCFIEWPEKISVYWPKRYVKIVLTILNETDRAISAEIIDE